MTLKIRPANSIDDCRQISALETLIWGQGSSVTLLISLMHTSSAMLIAADGDTAVGFCYSFLTYTAEHTLKHYSYILGVHPDYRDQNLGYRLKQAQREAVLAQGVDHMTWTYDPLETRNANLNLHKLRAVCNTYFKSFYGEIDDPLNQGLPTDRFQVDWWPASEWVTGPHDPSTSTLASWLEAGAVVVNPSVHTGSPYPRPTDAGTPLETKYCLVEVPDDVQAIKTADLNLARAWRLHTRALFSAAFEQGYTAVDLLRGDGRCYYLLQKGWSPA